MTKHNLNTIEEKDLISILSISPRLAKRIIALRPYSSFDRLDQIWGLDEESKKNIKDYFFVEPVEIIEKPIESEESSGSVDLVQKDKILPKTSIPQKQKTDLSRSSWFSSALLLLIFLLGAYFRFIGINWDEGKHQHPDERYLTMVAEKIHSVGSLEEYFDTANSTLNPVGHGSYTYGMLPLFVTRYVAEWVDMTNYDSINLVGRFLSGIFDLAAIWALYLLGMRLYGRRVALVAAALSAATVLPIQLSHFFAVDSFSTFFVVLSFYFLLLAVPIDKPNQIVSESNYIYFGLFGFLVGMAGACKVNTLPALGMIVFAGILYLLMIFKKPKFWKSFWTVFLGLFLAGLFAFLAFRIFQPYAFNGPTISDITINEKWLKVIKEVTNQVAGNSEWPPNHHWTSRPVQYAWVNMVLWGMGLPLGLMAWFGWGWAGYRIWKGEWRKHLFPFIWVLAYFMWQNMQFWRYMRYFIPIYPFLILFAAWALIELLKKTMFDFSINKWKIQKPLILRMNIRNNWKSVISLLVAFIVIFGTFAYAFAFTRIYTRTHTRVEASRWILGNIPGPLNILVETDGNGKVNSYPINVFNNRIVEKDAPATMDLKITSGGTSSMITAPQIKLVGSYTHFWISVDEEGKEIISEVRWVISDDEDRESLIIKTGETELKSGNSYFLHYRFRNNTEIAFDGIKIKRADQEDISFDVNLAFENQEPGIYVGKSEFIANQDLKINEIVLQNFHQKFTKSTAIFRVSILNEGDENLPLSVSEKTLQFSEPGIRLSEEFPFSPLSLEENKVYKVKLELVEGDAIQLLAENFTLETSWDDSLPLGVDGYNIGGIYSPFNLELYGADTPEKRDRMIEILDQSEYIIVPSNRGYDAMPRLVTRYPLTLRYYQLLFDCDCSGDEMEKWAYALEPPFSSPLGFDLIETFVSHPNLGPIQINDQNADESFTVYDHPKVFIFKKSESFSIERVRQALFEVDLDEVVFQRPIEVSRAPNGLKLPSDRLEIQTIGGTWSEIFNRSSLINQNSILMVVIWYLLIFTIGWMVLPLTYHVFASLPDRGYSFIRMLGLLILTWLSWFSGSLKILPFTKLTILFWLMLLLVINLFWFIRRKQMILGFIRSNLGYIIFVESIFLLLFIFSLHIRYTNPDLWHPWYGGEKPMEFAFFNAVNKSAYFPPQNPWFSDHYINYYYYGFIIAAIPTKLLGIIPASAFNLILPTWFAMTGIGMFGVGYNFYLGFAKKIENIEINHIEENLRNRKKRRFRLSPAHKSAFFVGIFALLFILLLGNFFQVKLLWENLPEVSEVIQDAGSDNQLVSVLSGAVNVISGEAELPGSPGRWYFSASRPILPDGPDTPIAEFPYFSFLYGDMHPHLLTMPFYALGFGWCLTLLLSSFHKQKWYQQILPFVLAGLIFGMYRVSHTWDFPIFIGLGTLSLLWMISKDKTLLFENQIRKIITYASIFIGLSIILYLPFSQWFKTAYNSIEIWDGAKTPLKDYFIVFGMSIFIMFGFLLDEIKTDTMRNIRDWKKLQLGQLVIPFVLILVSVAGSVALWKFNFQVLAFGWPLLIMWTWIIFIKKGVSDFRKLIWILFAGGYLITFVVEVVVLKGDVGRSNMVFRMYNLAWFILGLAMSLGLVEIRRNLKNWPKIYEYGWLFIFVILLLLGLTYQMTATDKKMNDRWPNVANPPKTLDGSLFMLGNLGGDGTNTPAIYKENEVDLDLRLDYEGITFMQDNIVGSPVIVEGHTSEYRWGGRYAIHTGLPSVIGWSWHTRQHNSLLDRAVVDQRIEQVNEFYNTTDINIAKEFLNKYRVSNIIVSGLERAYYSPEGLDKFVAMANQGELSIVFGDLTKESALIYKVIN